MEIDMKTESWAIGQDADSFIGELIRRVHEDRCTVSGWFHGVLVRVCRGDSHASAFARFQYKLEGLRIGIAQAREYSRSVRKEEWAVAERRHLAQCQFNFLISEAPPHMALVNQAEWQRRISNSEFSSEGMLARLAHLWARLMIVRIQMGYSVEECAAEMYELACLGARVPSCASVLSAAEVLSNTWVFGEELYLWAQTRQHVPA
jgi:hypothetical protein